jgi:hypothetical protein
MTTDLGSEAAVRIRCIGSYGPAGCHETVEILLSPHREDFDQQLSKQGWSLSLMERAEQGTEAVELLCSKRHGHTSTDPGSGARLQFKCCDCNRTAQVSLPSDLEDFKKQLGKQGWRLSFVKYRLAERERTDSLQEPLCPICEEAWMRWPP